jgi:hypothetical protein
MKCPKCGYISFDYNQVCPKCNKNISEEQERFFLPSFRPNPPSLLGFLTGDANESNVNLHTASGSHIDMDQNEDMVLNDDSAMMERENLILDEQDLELSFEPEDSEEVLFDQASMIEPDKFLSDSDFSLEEKESDEITTSSETEEGDEISLDLGDLSLGEQGGLLDAFSVDEADNPPETSTAESDFSGISLESLESLPVDIENFSNDIESEIELDLDDLKISDVGDLEIGSDFDASGYEMEGTFVESAAASAGEEVDAEGLTIDISEIPIAKASDPSEPVHKEEVSGDKEKTMILNDFSLDDPDSVDGGVFDFEDTPLGDSTTEEDDSLELEGFTLDINDSGEIEKSSIADDDSMNDSAELEKSFDFQDISLADYPDHEKAESASEESSADNGELDFDLDAMSLDVDEYQKGPQSSENDFVLDLEDMDIDLDLNEPKK